MKSAPDLSGRVALVTGASRGVGRGAALGLGESGATVYVTGRTLQEGQSPYPGSLEKTVAEIGELGGVGIPHLCNHRDDDAVRDAVERVIREQGRIDILVNNVYALPDDLELWSQKNFWEQPLSMWDDQIDVGLRSHYVATWYVAPHMIARSGGLIVNISSSGARQYHMNVAYGVGKAGVDKLSHDAAHELKPHGVAVVSLWPGLVATERIVATMGEEGLAQISSEQPLFTGRAVAALAADPEVMKKSGDRYLVYRLAEEYGFTDRDGSIPVAHDYL